MKITNCCPRKALNLVQVENWSLSKGNRIGFRCKTQLRQNYGFQSRRGLCATTFLVLGGNSPIYERNPESEDLLLIQ
jgi:hypothetical protein